MSNNQTILQIFFSSHHLLHPLANQYAGKRTCNPFAKRIDSVIAGLAHITLAIATAGIAPAWYYFKAKHKFQTNHAHQPSDKASQSFKQNVPSNYYSPPNSNAGIITTQPQSKVEPRTEPSRKSPFFNVPTTESEFLADHPPVQSIYTFNSREANSTPKHLTEGSAPYLRRTREALSNYIQAGSMPLPSYLSGFNFLLNPAVSSFVNWVPDFIAKTAFTKAHQQIGQHLVPGGGAEDRRKALECRKEIYKFIHANPHWTGKRISIDCNGNKIDAYIFGKKENIDNGRWTLYSNGHGFLSEYAALGCISDMERLNSNFILFNYPGVGCSEGPATRNNIVASYEAILSFLEDDVRGIGAREIIGWGCSMGGGVQGHALKRHRFQQQKKYVFIKDQTYRTLQDAVASMMNPVLGAFVKATGWQLTSKSSSKKLDHPEIVIQKASKLYPESKEDIQHDGLFTPEASLSGHLLEQKTAKEWNKKRFIGIQQDHGRGFNENERNAIFKAINDALKPDFATFS